MTVAPSFPRGKKPTAVQTPATAALQQQQQQKTKQPPHHKKRKHAATDPEQSVTADVDGEAAADDDVDALFGKKGVALQQQQQKKQQQSAKPAGGKPKVRKVTAVGGADVKNQAKQDKAAETATALTFKTLTRNMLVLGCVRQISDTELMLSLPNKLTGVVAYDEVSDECHTAAAAAATKSTKADDGEREAERPSLPALFRVGQFVPCIVLAKSKENASKKLSLSMRLTRIHAELGPTSIAKGMTMYGTVASVEDHGAMINLGVRGLHAFAPMRELTNANMVPAVGQHALFVVTAMNAHTSTATLSPDPAQVTRAVTRGDGFTMNQLTPGMLLNVRVEDVLTNGLRVNFLTFFSATVEQNHMSNPCEADWAEAYRKGMKGRARIISINRTTKDVTLSMAPHVVHLALPPSPFVIGDVIENATIERIDAGIGMLLSLATGSKQSKTKNDADADGDASMDEGAGEEAEEGKKGNWQSFQPAYVHISNAADGHVDKLEKKFTVGEGIKCRVIGFAPFDGIVNVSCKESSLSQLVLRHKDLTPGLKVRGKILAIESWGVLLEISEGVRGVVSVQHVPPFLALKKKSTGKKDTQTGSGKYTVGKSVEARVLRVDLEAKKTYLTMKKALLTADEGAILASYEDATTGRVAQGYITKIAEYGVVVSFYNNVYGLVPAALLHQAGITNLAEAYVVGQVVRACVTRCDVQKQRLMLTFDLTGTVTKAATKGAVATAASEDQSALVGKLLRNATIMEIEGGAFRLQTEDGLEAVLPFVHLTDFPRETALVDALVQRWSVGDVVAEPLLVVAVARDGVLTLSRKPLLVHSAAQPRRLPRTLEQVKPGALLVGVVASVSPSRGVFVRFLNHLTALAPKAFLSDKFVTEVEAGSFEMGETVVCHVEKVETDKQQFVVGVRDYRALKSGLATMAPPLIEAFFKEQQLATAGDESPGAPLALGKTEKAVFVGVRPYGAVFTLQDESVTVIVPGVDEATAADWDQGDKVKLLLVDYDFEKRLYIGSVAPELVASGAKKARKHKTRLTKQTAIAGARVVAIRGGDASLQKYAIVAFADPQQPETQQLAILQVADYWCPSRTCASVELEVGSVVPSAYVTSPALGSLQTPFDGLPVLVYEDEELLAASAKKTSASKNKKLTDEPAEHLPKYANEDLALGKLVTGRIIGIKEHSMEIKLKTSSKCGKVVALVSIVDVDAPTEEGEAHPFDRFNVNMVVRGRILAAVEKGANQRKPVSESNPANFHALSLSLRAQDVDMAEPVALQALVRADWQEHSAGRALLQPGTAVEGVVVEHETDGVLVRLSHRVVAFVAAIELSRDLAVLGDYRTHFAVGRRVRGWILAVDEDKKHLDVSLVRASAAPPKVGAVLPAMITTKLSVLKAPAVMVQLGAHTFARACITELLSPAQWVNAMHELPAFAHGAFAECVVVASEDKQLDVSFRADARADPKAYAAAPAPTYQVGDLVPAVVASTTASGCFLRVNRRTLARVLLRDLSDEFIKDPKAQFPMGKLVVGRVTRTTDKGLEMSLKASVVSEDVAMVQWSDLREGLTVKGTITKVQSYGVFVRIEKSNISGLCHISEIADERVTQALDQIFSEGDYVKAKILKIEDRRVSFGLKPSYFEGEPESSDEEEDDDEESEEDEDEDEEAEAEAMEVEEEQATKKPMVVTKAKAKTPTKSVKKDDDEDMDSSSEDDDDEDAAAKSVEFTWDGFANVLDQHRAKDTGDSSDDDDDDEDKDSGADAAKTRRTKQQQKKQTEEWIALREKALASNEERPQTADDYERLVAVNPQSSFLWIQYMAFHVSLTEVDLARDVAVRATSAVSFRDEKEKLNVWVAYLNLEHDFGDDASFLRVFNSALRVNHPKRVYLQLVDIYARANEHEDAATTLATMQKKFRKSKQIWSRALQYHVAQGAMGEAAETLQRALKSLAAHKHLVVILKYGQLMYEHDEVDKARTIFEGILANYPKRLDLWSVYVDKEIKFGGDAAYVRAVFERLVAMEFSAKKMKFLFKKYLQFEQTHGDEASIAHVKQLAKDFVAQAGAGAGASA